MVNQIHHKSSQKNASNIGQNGQKDRDDFIQGYLIDPIRDHKENISLRISFISISILAEFIYCHL